MSFFTYQRRGPVRFILKSLIYAATAAFTRLEIHGLENVPEEGPLIVVANHFHYADPVVVIRAMPWDIDFIAGAVPGFAPRWSHYLPRLWGGFWVYRGAVSRKALRDAERLLRSGGRLGIFPEGGSWAEVLRPPRPGTAYLAVRTGAPVLPIGMYGLHDLFPLRVRNRPRLVVNIGKPFGPFRAEGRGRQRRERLEEIGHIIMQKIAELLPPEMRGHYSDDPAIREAAKPFEAWPWENAVEGEVGG